MHGTMPLANVSPIPLAFGKCPAGLRTTSVPIHFVINVLKLPVVYQSTSLAFMGQRPHSRPAANSGPSGPSGLSKLNQLEDWMPCQWRP